MKISIDPIVASRIRHAWAALPADQRNRIAPLLAKANQQAVTVAQSRKAPAPDPTVPHQALLAQSAITNDQDGVVNSLEAGIVIDVGADGEIWGTGKYEQLDPGWAEAVAVWLEHLILGNHAFNSATPNTIPIADDFQIAIAGDWGTGDWRTAANPAPSTDVGNHIRFLEPHLTIHLGDVYYSGTSDQEQHLLTNIWPAGSQGALTLNSNHEMYSGAKPYFDQALGNKVFALQQKCSFFALENTNWVIVGLDSAYYSESETLYMNGAIYKNGGPMTQLDFLKAQVAKGKKVIVLTHHNGRSDDGSTATALWQQVMSAFPDGGGPAYWYWGHVHLGAVYDLTKLDPPSNVLCRCCGHGALPIGVASGLLQKPTVAWFEKRPANDPDIPQRVLNGFALLHFKGPDLEETFFDENGGIAWPLT